MKTLVATLWFSLAALGLGALPADAGARESVLVFPNAFRVYRLDSSGAVEIEPEATEQTRRNLDLAAHVGLNISPDLERAPFPDLTDAEQAIVDEHIALFEANALAAWQMIAEGDIDEKRIYPRYTIGPGLRFLAGKTDADKAMVITGGKQFQTGGRMFWSTLTTFLSYYGFSQPASGVLIGIIDLRTGVIEWMHGLQPLKQDVREMTGSEEAMSAMLEAFPHGGLYPRVRP